MKKDVCYILLLKYFLPVTAHGQRSITYYYQGTIKVNNIKVGTLIFAQEIF